MKGQSPVTSFMDCMELMKKGPVSRWDIARKSGITKDTADKWVKLLKLGGFVADVGTRPKATGGAERLYTVTKEWGGQA